MSNLLNDQGQVGCAVCNKFYTIITSNHLRKEHNITMVDYKEKYPDAPLAGEIFSSKQKFKYKGGVLTNGVEEDSISDAVVKPEISNSNIMKVAKIQPPTNENYYGVHDEKVRVLKYLKIFFPNIINNYIFDKYSMSGHLEYQIVMDVADVANRIDFEFPSTFWHNTGFTDKHYRDQRLKDSGWRIVTIPSQVASNFEVGSILRELKIIK
jgi:hypothetical protein